MAVYRNPYRKWEDNRRKSDYRCTDTQITSLVRQQLSQTEYLRDTNRINQGPSRNQRTNLAKSRSQIPHVLASEDMWGWQPWTTLGDIEIQGTTPLATNLIFIDYAEGNPGTSYQPYNKVGGMSHTDISISDTYTNPVDTPQFSDNYIIVDYVPTNYIGGIKVDTSGIQSIPLDTVMIFDKDQTIFKFVPYSYVLGLADGDENPENIDFGSY